MVLGHPYLWCRMKVNLKVKFKIVLYSYCVCQKLVYWSPKKIWNARIVERLEKMISLLECLHGDLSKIVR
jgi:hypothetical protein